MTGTRLRTTALGLALGLCAGAPALAQEGGNAGTSGPAAMPLAERASGSPISAVVVSLVRGSDNPARDQAIRTRVEAALADLPGTAFDRVAIQTRLARLRSRIGAGRIDTRLTDGLTPGTVTIIVEIDTLAAGPDAAAVTGAFIEGLSGLPALYRDDRSLLTAIITGGFGLYSDGEPWFGQPELFNARNPLAGHLPGPRATWTEGYVEAGLGGATQIGDSPFYAYGAATVLGSWSLGQDIFQDDPRLYTAIERAYAGLLYVDPDSTTTVNLSLGRQNVTLNDGFLIHFVRGSSNAGERGGLYLGPRNANDFSAVANASFGGWRARAFYIDPNEIESLESGSTFAGVNLGRDLGHGLSADASLITIPESRSSYANPQGLDLPRAGVTTLAAHARWLRAFGVPGLWVESEVAHQTNPDYAMDAFAAYGLIGYRAANLPWTPSLSWRYAFASGDNPATPAYERFDPLLSTGLGNWLQGVTFGKITTNSNLAVHRLQFNVAPTPNHNITLEWYLLRAPERNNLGSNPALSTLSSNDLGQEFTLSSRWAINDNLYLQSLASIALPGEALIDIGADEPWTTLQASLYWTY